VTVAIQKVVNGIGLFDIVPLNFLQIWGVPHLIPDYPDQRSPRTEQRSNNNNDGGDQTNITQTSQRMAYLLGARYAI
jgi:hypothetical protein